MKRFLLLIHYWRQKRVSSIHVAADLCVVVLCCGLSFFSSSSSAISHTHKSVLISALENLFFFCCCCTFQFGFASFCHLGGCFCFEIGWDYRSTYRNKRKTHIFSCIFYKLFSWSSFSKINVAFVFFSLLFFNFW